MVYQTYSEKLQSPKWQQRRLKIFERDEWKCRCCGNNSRQLQVHHVDYIHGIEPWDYSDDMLVTLCNICHDKERAKRSLTKNPFIFKVVARFTSSLSLPLSLS